MTNKIQKIDAKKSLGQHFLNSAYVPTRMADVAEVCEGDSVLEVGAGTGVLTKELLLRGATVKAIETDLRALEALKETFSDEITEGKLELFDCDIRTTPLSEFGVTEHAYKVVSNIPYYLSGKLFRLFLASNLQPAVMVFLVQKEVAERIARSKKESLLSLSVKAYGDPHYISTIKRTHFSPPPKVDSAIIAITNITHAHLEGIGDDFFFEVLHEGFKAKRKQLIGNLSKTFERDTLIKIFSTLSLQESTRAEDIELEKWLTLVKKLQSTHSSQTTQ